MKVQQVFQDGYSITAKVANTSMKSKVQCDQVSLATKLVNILLTLLVLVFLYSSIFVPTCSLELPISSTELELALSTKRVPAIRPLVGILQ